ncbi:MAG: precorrin-6y C5,15-methyltransferase (decarboxylating) subunit CbiE [Oscillatoria princeps RMCB-10]|jgi:precorrin-6Y C5,15-methyltransferase (decarboxylating)|nr:precorrin-6y C5,15-methyltransferase (decarboxylating) subunit CbiE [Oscillatoria princeps RMCB-10]
MTAHVVGIGLDGAAGLAVPVLKLVESATLLVGSERHLGYFPDHPAQRQVLGDLTEAIAAIRNCLAAGGSTVVLVSGDPLFFGFGRLLLAALPPELLTFHPHLSSVQLAFNRLKVPWHDARTISAHGRSADELLDALRSGAEKLAVLTDGNHTPAAIARLVLSLDLPYSYDLWVCENLGGAEERVQSWPALEAGDLPKLEEQTFDPLNVVVLLRRLELYHKNIDLSRLPLLGLPDRTFISFSDRPGLMTKREIRTLVLGELGLAPGQIIWDVGAGTGSVSIEIARLCPSSRVYAIEKTAAGTMLIEQNCRRLQVTNVISIYGSAPEILYRLPAPDRIVIGGTGGQLRQILGVCGGLLTPGGTIVLALATVENLNDALIWAGERARREGGWSYRLLQVQLSRSVPVGSLTRFSPLNPVTLLTVTRESN